MKVTLNVAFCLVSAFAVLGAPPVALAQVDSTGILPLRGTPRLEAPVPIQNQGGGGRPWTMHFVGQTRNYRGMVANILSDGRINVYWDYSYGNAFFGDNRPGVYPTPYLDAQVILGTCAVSRRVDYIALTLAPSATASSAGVPTNWGFNGTVCPGSGGR